MEHKLIIFDFDGTLADTAPTILATYSATIRHLGLPDKSEAEMLATIGLPLRECYRKLFPESSEEFLDKCTGIHLANFERNKKAFVPVLYPGVKDTLARLHEMGYSLSIASSRSHDSLIDLCQTLGIYYYFVYVLSGDDVERAKPDPFPVLKTLHELNFESDETVVVGDMPVDILMGKSAGCKTIGVDYGNASRQELIDAGASAIASSFSDILKL